MRWILCTTLLTLLGCQSSSPSDRSEGQAEWDDGLSVRWIYEPAVERPRPLPSFQWLPTGEYLFFDPRSDDPSLLRGRPDGSSEAAVDLVAAASRIDHWASARSFTWPLAFSEDGKRALYLFDGDVFVLDLPSSSWIRVTETSTVEKAVTLSPDGRSVSFARDGDLHVYSLEERKEVAITGDGVPTLLDGTLSWVYWEEIFGRRDVASWWSDDSQALAFLRSDEAEVAVSRFVDFEPWTPRVIEQRYPKAGTTNPKITIGVVRFDGGPGEVQWLDLAAVPHEYVIRVQWLPDGRRLAVQTMNRAQTKLDLWFVDPNDDSWTHVLEEQDSGWINLHDDLLFLPDGEHFLWQSERTGYAHLYRYRMDGTCVNAVSSGDWAVRSSGGVFWMRQAIAGVDAEEGWVYFTGLKDSPLQRHVYRSRFDGSDFERVTTKAGTHRVYFSDDGRWFFDVHTDHRSPPKLTLWNARTSESAEVAGRDHERLASLSLLPREMFVIPTRDGFAMPADILCPPDFDPDDQYPVVIYVYGGPSAPTVLDDWDDSLYFDNILARSGFVVLRVDNRSATAISKTLENSILDGMYGDSELGDLMDALDWLESRPFVDPDRIGIWGWSGGGTFTLLAMTGSERFRAGIAVAAVTDWRYYDTKWAEFAMKDPQTNAEAYDGFDLNARAKDLHGRLMLVHGTYDDNVHPANMWKFADSLIEAGKPFDMMVYPMRKHGISDAAARIHLYEKMLEFWCEELQP